MPTLDVNCAVFDVKATSDLLAKHLQEELVQMTVNLKRAMIAQSQTPPHQRQESIPCQQREEREGESMTKRPPLQMSQEILAELSQAGEAVAFGSYGTPRDGAAE